MVANPLALRLNQVADFLTNLPNLTEQTGAEIAAVYGDLAPWIGACREAADYAERGNI